MNTIHIIYTIIISTILKNKYKDTDIVIHYYNHKKI
jgi:hypothetical protein